jgi:hypothetical protein
MDWEEYMEKYGHLVVIALSSVSEDFEKESKKPGPMSVKSLFKEQAEVYKAAQLACERIMEGE